MSGAPRAVRAKVHRIALVQHASTPPLDEGVRGLIQGLAEQGFRDGDAIRLSTYNAQGDMPTGIAIARQVTARRLTIW